MMEVPKDLPHNRLVKTTRRKLQWSQRKGEENGENIKRLKDIRKDKQGDSRGPCTADEYFVRDCVGRTVRCEIPDRNPLYESLHNCKIQGERILPTHFLVRNILASIL